MTVIEATNYCKPNIAGETPIDVLVGLKSAIKAVKSATTSTTTPTFHFAARTDPISKAKVPTTYWVSDSLIWDAASKNTDLQMDPGVRIKYLPNRPLSTTRGGNGYLQGRHLFVITNVNVATFRQAEFDLNGAQQTVVNPLTGKQEFVGDVLRVQNGSVVDAQNVTVYNPRGLTTNSSIDMPETFAIQWLRVNKVIEDKVSCLALDGAPTATGIVSHWVMDTFAKGGISYGVSGQGFGTYAGGKYKRITSWANHCGNGFNIEGGDTGMTTIQLGDPLDPTLGCVSTNNRRAIVINGNPGKIQSLTASNFTSDTDINFLAITGTLPGAVSITGKVSNPSSSVFNMLCGTNNQTALNLIKVPALSVHKATTVPLVSPKTLKVPTTWKVSYF